MWVPLREDLGHHRCGGQRGITGTYRGPRPLEHLLMMDPADFRTDSCLIRFDRSGNGFNEYKPPRRSRPTGISGTSLLVVSGWYPDQSPARLEGNREHFDCLVAAVEGRGWSRRRAGVMHRYRQWAESALAVNGAARDERGNQ
jgi:hypothetical protein